MYEKVTGRSEGGLLVFQALTSELIADGLALDDRIDEFADLVQKHYRVDEFADPNAATEVCFPHSTMRKIYTRGQETTTIVGRIVHDADISASGTKLNESSLVLESSRMMGSGVRVPIRFAPETKLRGGIKGVGGISFFPGAIVALRGRNGGGGFFLVEEILSVRYTPSIPNVFSRPIGIPSSCLQSKCPLRLRVMPTLPFPCVSRAGHSAWTRI